MLLVELVDQKLIHPPSFLPLNTCYLTLMGSQAYGVSTETSDYDLYGFTIPPREIVFPHLAGHVHMFGRQRQEFEQFSADHVMDKSACGGKGREYDITVFNIVKYFNLLMENNPNILDSIFTPQNCVLHITAVGHMVRENRKMFLHKGCYHKFKGYAFSQLHKMATKNPEGKRKEIRDKYGFDVKFAMHTIRLLGEAEQILSEGDIDLQRNNEHLKAIRRGEVSEADIRKWAADKEHHLEKLYTESKLPYGPDEEKIKDLLLSCLEHHYGNLEKAIVRPDKYKVALMNVKEILDKVI